MSNVHQFRSEEERYDEASLWIERLSEGLTPDEEIELRVWLSQDPANQAVLEKMARLWDRSEEQIANLILLSVKLNMENQFLIELLNQMFQLVTLQDVH